ncbi:hypothetical protein ACJMK2_015977, partial [Sinanodonta woodiana]
MEIEVFSEIEIPAECKAIEIVLNRRIVYPHKRWNKYAASKEGKVYHIDSGREVMGIKSNDNDGIVIMVSCEDGSSQCMPKSKFAYEACSGIELLKASNVIHNNGDVKGCSYYNLIVVSKGVDGNDVTVAAESTLCHNDGGRFTQLEERIKSLESTIMKLSRDYSDLKGTVVYKKDLK